MHRQRSASRGSRASRASSHTAVSERGIQIGLSLTPAHDRIFDACAATASFFLFAQRNTITCLHHDTLEVERKFNGHAEDVIWIETDNNSETGAGRMVASYDSKSMTIIWDIITGRTVARLEPYGDIRVASWMRNGTIAFGNSQGNITLFEPNTKENMSVRTIYTPITALAPALDCRTFAIGYITGSILIATLRPNFTILHTLNTQRTPSPINCLGWHGSSRSDMLASQTMDGDLRVWSIPRGPNGDPPAVIRHFDQGEARPVSGPCWFAWSKSGRIIQYSDGSTTSWDVRTKRVTYESVPTIDGIVGISNYGPHAVLFTVGRNHTVQQYDLNPDGTPMLVRNVQHMPAGNTPPSPPSSEHGIGSSIDRRGTPLDITSDSENDGDYEDPLRRMARDPDDMAEEADILAPLSPVSSAASSSRSSVKQGTSKRKVPQYPSRYDRQSSSRLRPQSPGMMSQHSSQHGSQHNKTPSTVFSGSSSTASSRKRHIGSRLRNETPRSPQETGSVENIFPFIEERLKEVQFRPPRYPDGERTPDFLRQELLRCIFGWDGEADELIRYEISHHEPGSTVAVLLSKWLGDLGADFATSMMGETMSSSDWMLLALSTVGGDSQKKIGDAFVQRLLEKGDVHPAVAILLGLGENNEAIEIYVSQGKFMEAVILACLIFPTDWGRISHLAREWGGQAIEQKNKPDKTELAVRCFACTSVQSSEPWFSPAAKDAVYEAQMRILGPELSPVVSSPQSATGRRQLAALPKLTTNFTGGKGPANLRSGLNSAMGGKTPMIGQTPMDTSIPDGARITRWQQEPMSSVTATPGGMTSRRLTSRDRSRDPFSARPPPSAIKTRQDDSYYKPASYMPSPAASAFSQEKIQSRQQRNMSRDRKPGNLHVETNDIYADSGLPTGFTVSTADRTDTTSPAPYRRAAPSPAMTEMSHRSRVSVSHNRTESRQKPSSRATSRNRAPSDAGRRYVQPGKRSPSSPVSMSPDDPLLQVTSFNRPLEVPEIRQDEGSDAEKFYRMASPTNSIGNNREMMTSPTGSGVQQAQRGRSSSSRPTGRRAESADPSGRHTSRTRGTRTESRARSPNREPGARGRSRAMENTRRSPTSPVSMRLGVDDYPRSARPRDDYDDVPRSARPRDAYEEAPKSAKPRDQSIGARVRARGTSAARNRDTSPDRYRQTRERSSSVRGERRAESPPRASSRTMSRSRRPSIPRLQTNFSDTGAGDNRKNQAAQDLEARRRSLARRPSAPVIMHPDDLISPRLEIDDPYNFSQAHIQQNKIETARSTGRSIRSTTSNVQMGLPSNPKAMRHAETMSSYQNEDFDSQPLATAGLPILSSAAFQPARSASVPAERMNQPRHVSRESNGGHGRLHQRMGSLTNNMMTPPPPPPAMAVDEDASAILRSSVAILPDETNEQSVILPELQHLTNTTTPTFNPASLGVINIGMATPEAMVPAGLPSSTYQPPATASPGTARRGRGSISHGSTDLKQRGVSRRRDQSQTAENRIRSPYESVQDPIARSQTQTAPPMESLTLAPVAFNPHALPPPPPPPPIHLQQASLGGLPTLSASTYAPTLSSAAYNPNASYQPSVSPQTLPSNTTGYRTPKEIARAAALAQQQQENMLQFGVNAEKTASKGNMAGYKNPKELRANMPPNTMQQSDSPVQKLNGAPF